MFYTSDGSLRYHARKRRRVPFRSVSQGRASCPCSPNCPRFRFCISRPLAWSTAAQSWTSCLSAQRNSAEVISRNFSNQVVPCDLEDAEKTTEEHTERGHPSKQQNVGVDSRRRGKALPSRAEHQRKTATGSQSGVSVRGTTGCPSSSRLIRQTRLGPNWFGRKQYVRDALSWNSEECPHCARVRPNNAYRRTRRRKTEVCGMHFACKWERSNPQTKMQPQKLVEDKQFTSRTGERGTAE